MSRRSGYEDLEFVSDSMIRCIITWLAVTLNSLLIMLKKPAGKILELGCGTGRVLIPTALAGYDITASISHRICLKNAVKKSRNYLPKFSLMFTWFKAT